LNSAFAGLPKQLTFELTNTNCSGLNPVASYCYEGKVPLTFSDNDGDQILRIEYRSDYDQSKKTFIAGMFVKTLNKPHGLYGNFSLELYSNNIAKSAATNFAKIMGFANDSRHSKVEIDWDARKVIISCAGYSETLTLTSGYVFDKDTGKSLKFDQP
jgi:hypothetical protein